MNQNTWISWVTTGIGLLSSAAATKGAIDQNTAVSIAGAAGTLVPLLWGLFIHRDSKVVQTAGSIQGVKPVEIGPSAAPELQKLAMDPTVPTVVVAPPPPFVSSTVSQRR